MNTEIKKNNVSSKEYEKEIINLKNELNKANKIIENQKLKIQELENIINKLKNNNEYICTIKNLECEIKNKENELNQLKKELKNTNKNIVNVERDQLISVFFHHPKYSYSIACINSDTFAEVEEKFYKEFPELRNTNNVFLVNGREVLRFRTIEDNKIKNGYPVLLQMPDNS